MKRTFGILSSLIFAICLIFTLSACSGDKTCTHEYSNACDDDCNLCAEPRNASHSYDHDYDATCNVCNLVREIPYFTEGLKYTLNSDEKSYSVLGIGTVTDTEVVIPPIYNDLPVTRIESDAFKNYYILTSVTIPDCITSIGNSAFLGCKSLTNITIPNSITSIGGAVFGKCTSLTNITIPNSVTSIGEDAFHGCSGLTSVTIGDNVKAIGKYAFENCYGLTDVYITDLTTWCNIDFKNPSANPLCYANNLYLNGELLTNLVIPEGVTALDNCLFQNCSNLTSVTIPNSLTSIGAHAFHSCYKITNITIPDSVTSIGEEAFRKCSALTGVTIGNGVTTIGKYAFMDCNSLTSVYITDLAAWCNINFDYSRSSNPLNYAKNLYLNGTLITNLVIPDGVTSIGDSVFSNCTSLTSVIIPDGVTSIGAEAFHSCNNLTNVTIPDSVTSINSSAFGGCSNLYAVYNNSDLTLEIGSYDNGSIAYYAKVIVNKDSTDYPDGNYKYILTEDGFLFRYPYYRLIAYCGNKETVTLPKDINGIAYKILNMRGAVNVIIPDNITSISNNAFYDCDILTSVTVPNSVTSIDNLAFARCSGLTDVYYTGTEEEWAQISIGSENSYLTNATIHYNYAAE